MREHRGSIAGVPWVGHIIERSDDLVPFMDWVKDQRGTVAFDLETCGLGIYTYGPGFVRVAQFGTTTDAYFVPVEYGPQFAEAARRALETLPLLCGHNSVAYDGLAADKHLGYPLEKLCAKMTDSMILARLVDPRGPEAGGLGASLKPLSAKYVDPTAPDTGAGLDAVFKSYGWTKKSGLGWSSIPVTDPTYEKYGCLDVILASHLRVALCAELKKLGVRDALVGYEHQISRMCATMSRSGMLVDKEYTETLYGTLADEKERYNRQAERYGVENVNSNTQVIEALQGMGEAWTELTDGGQPSVAKDVLLPMADLTPKWERIGARTPNPVAEAVLHAQRAGKWSSAYVDTFLNESDPDGYLHPNINTLQARTGRMSITKPAVQTLPSGDWTIRRALLADPGHVFVSTDFAAVEMRVLAALADVRKMKEAINAGEDLHGFTARLVYGENFTPYHRKVCKGIGFGRVYGGGAATVARQTGAPLEDVQRAMAAYDRVYPEIKRFSKRMQREAFDNDMVTISRTGRRLPLDRDRTYAVVNFQCQSAGRDVLGQSMVNADKAGLLPYIKLVVHDEQLASVPKGDAKEFTREFEKCMTFDLDGVPISAEAEIGGRSWGSLYQSKEERDADPMGW